jgi:ABC-type uncharacterized transport system ATPase subunit
LLGLDERVTTWPASHAHSSKLPEVINLSTRILVMRDGSLAGEYCQEASQESVLRLMASVPTATAA